MRRISITVLALALVAMSAAGCKKKPAEHDGPMESAGEEADKAGHEVKESVEEAGDEVEDATD